MSKLTKNQIKIAYAQTIQILFGGAVKTTPNQINEQVIDSVDKMVKEIAKCSEAMTGLSFKVIYKAATIAVVNPLVDKYIDNFYHRLTVRQSSNQASKELERWIKTLMGNRKHMFCVVTARSKWRSKIELELLGL